MSEVKLIRYDSFVGGLNLRADPFQLGDSESPDMLNVDVDPRGGFAMRGGITRFNTEEVLGLSAGAFEPEVLFSWVDGSPQLLLAANGKVLYATTSAFVDTTITTTSDQGASFASWSGSSADLVYVACGSGSAQMAKWDGVSKTLLTASGAGEWQDSLTVPDGTHMPMSDLVASHVDRLWVASTSEDAVAYPNRVRFSHPTFPESWREEDFIDIVDGGSGITALLPFAGSLLVFKKNSIHAIYGADTSTFQVVTLTREIGVPTSHCVATTENRVYFFSWPQGLFSFDGDKFTDQFLSLRPLIELGMVNESGMGNVWVSMVARRVFLSLPQGSDANPTFTYVMDPTLSDTGAWTRYQLSDGGGLAGGCDFVAANGSTFPLLMHPSDPFVMRINQSSIYQDDMTGIPADFPSYYVTKWVDAGSISARKMWRRPDFVVQQPQADTTLTVQVFRNWEESIVRRTFLMQLVAIDTGLSWAVSEGDYLVTEDGLFLITEDGDLLFTGTGDADDVDGWGEAVWGASATGSQFERGSNLGLARAVQLKVSGPGGLPWGVNTISYKYLPRKVR